MPRQISFAGAALAAAAAALVATAACAPRPATLRIATTTSVDNSGLLEAIVPAFEREHGASVQVLAVGSGRAFQIGRRGDASLLITHEPIGERALFSDGLVRYYRKVMFNRFVIAGPPSDPAQVSAATSAADAMRRITRSGAAFASRGDESGTHAREQRLWADAGVEPGRRHLIETGQGMSSTLRVASERGAYVLTDEATLIRLEKAVHLRALFSADAALSNTYAVIILSTARPASNPLAATFAQWLAEGGGQARIGAFRINGRQVFFPWPPGADAAVPESLPPVGR